MTYIKKEKIFEEPLYFFYKRCYNIKSRVFGESNTRKGERIMHNREYDPTFEYLIRGFLMLQNPDECREFLYDLCTESELQEMSRRLQAAKMLKNGHI